MSKDNSSSPLNRLNERQLWMFLDAESHIKKVEEFDDLALFGLLCAIFGAIGFTMCSIHELLTFLYGLDSFIRMGKIQPYIHTAIFISLCIFVIGVMLYRYGTRQIQSLCAAS